MSTAAPLSFLEAIAREEGFFVAGTRANRNRNPGNIEFGNFAKRHGALSSDGRFAVFPTAEAGWGAMKDLFADYKGFSFAAAVAKWAPPTENDTAQYVRNVCRWTGLPPETCIDEHLGYPAPLFSA